MFSTWGKQNHNNFLNGRSEAHKNQNKYIDSVQSLFDFKQRRQQFHSSTLLRSLLKLISLIALQWLILQFSNFRVDF